jgi:hypothetical protein
MRRKVGLRLIAFLLLVPGCAFCQTNQKIPGLPNVSIDARGEQAQPAVAGARAGNRLTAKGWPNGARVAVCISFDVDNDTWRMLRHFLCQRRRASMVQQPV